MNKTMKIVLILLVVIVVAIGGFLWYVLGSMRSDAVETVEKPDLEATGDAETEASIFTVDADEPTPSPTPMPIYEEETLEDSVINILLIGTDSRLEDTGEDSDGRSDSMILASLNKDTGKITLVSFMRDARVKRIGSSGKFTFYNRLNGAYSGGYAGGGPGELINTINYNFGLDIQEYIAIGFDGFATLIDEIGGLDVELDQAEINFINDRIKGDHELEPDIVKNASTISEDPGVIHLDGAQCLIYARNRHTGVDGGDGNVRTGGSRLGSLVERGGDALVHLGDLAFEDLRHFFLALRRDLVDAAGVGDGLLDDRLGQRDLQVHQLLHVLGSQQGLGVGHAVFQQRTGGVQVQGGEALGAGEGGVGQGQQGLDVGLVGGGELLGGDEVAHVDLLEKCGCINIASVAAMLRCSMVRIIRTRFGLSSIFLCIATSGID